MTKLEDLYQAIKTLKEAGIQLPEKLIEDTSKVEEDIIKKDILPLLADIIDPIINQIKREIILVVEYIPDEPLSVRLTRKKSLSISSEQEVLVEKKSSAFTERESVSISPHSKSAWTGLRVKFSDGKNISHRFAYETLVDAIRVIGHEKVKALNIVCCGVPLVSSVKDDFYSQHELSKGIYIMTHSSTKGKRDQLEEISDKLKLNLKVTIE